MANPFLMMDDELEEAPVQMPAFETNHSPQSNADLNSNPFLMQADDELDEIEASVGQDNPFSVAPTQRPPSSNPFAFDDEDDGHEMMGIDNHGVDDFMDEEIKTNVVVTTVGQSLFMTATTITTGVADHAMSFFGTTITDEMDKDNFGSDYEEELELKAQKTAHDLILSVADQLDQNSSHLLGRIPATRTPSPVSMRDLHSPSPEPVLGDLLDVGAGSMPAVGDLHMSESDSMSNIPQMDENPFMTPTVVQKMPPRPPPPRPPARPVSPAMLPQHPIRPPPPASAIVHQQIQPAPPQASEPDLFDIFGDVDVKPTPPRPPVPKSKEDILSLFSTPQTNVPSQQIVHNQQPDLLSMDNDEGPSSLPPPFGDPMGTNFASMHTTEPQQQQQAALLDQQSTKEDTQIQPTFEESQPSKQEPEMHLELTEENLPEPIDITQPLRIQPTITETLVASLPPSPDEFEEHGDISSAASDISQAPSDTNVASVMPDDNESVTEVVSPPFEDEVPVSYPAPTPVQVPSPPQPVVVNPFADDGLDLSFAPAVPAMTSVPPIAAAALDIFAAPAASDEFDAFSAKFESVSAPKHDTDIFLDGFGGISASASSCGDAWGANDDVSSVEAGAVGFDADDGFDSFMAMEAPAALHTREDSHDSDDAKEFNVVIRPKDPDTIMGTSTPVLAPPPPKSSQNNSMYSGDSSPRFNPFDKGEEEPDLTIPGLDQAQQLQRTDSQETPPTPLFDEDVSQPLEDFPRTVFSSTICWEMQLRQPNKKKITGQRFWKKIFIKLVYQGDSPVLQLFSTEKDKEPFQELPLQACYSVSDIGAQQYDQFGKIFTVKLQYIFYKERPGVRPGQVTKAERLTNKLSQFAAYAIQGDYQGVKEFGSDLKKLGLPVEHAPQISQLFKIGSMTFEDLKQFSVCVEEALFKMNVHRDRALNYKMEEVQITAVDELYVEQTSEGNVTKQIARVRLFLLGFLSGMPTIELGLNDLWRQGKEVVGRHDIIPVVTEEWIRMEGVDFHMCVQQDEYERSRTIKFQPPDACYIELMRFRVRPPKNRELPLQLKATWVVTGNKVELRADILVPGFASRKLGQIPCEDVSIRFPIPECWIYLFRVEKHFRYGSVKSAHRRTGKIKGIERILGTVDTLQESLIEVTSGQAKYEHHHRAIVWRCPRLPKEGQGAYTTHQMVVRMALTSFDQIPEQLAPHCFVEFTMPATQVSHVTVRSVSVQDSESDEPPEKYVRYLARHEYTVGIEHTTGDAPNAYLAATATKPAVIKEEPAQPIATSPMVQSDSDSDSN